MALQGPSQPRLPTSSRRRRRFRRVPDDEEDPHHEEDHHNEPRAPGDPSQPGSDPQDPEDSADDNLGMDPIPEARYLRFGPADTIQELQSEFNEWAKTHGFAVVRANGRNK